MQVTLTIAPASVVVGKPAEVLLRTFVPTGWEELGMEAPGSWPFVPDTAYVLWPVPDYPFSVVAQADDGAEIPLVMTLDPVDPTLWRGVFVPDTPGMWRVRATNFPESDPGANVTFAVVPAPASTSLAPAGAVSQ